MNSKAETGKSTASKNARDIDGADTTDRRKTTAARKTGAGARKSRAAGTRKKEAAGPPVYASDVVATKAGGAAGAKDAPTIPAVLEPPKQDELQLSPIEEDLPLEYRPAQVLKLAEEAFAKTGSWVVFYRTMLAPGGVVDRLYSDPESRRYFETTREFSELLEMLTAMRSQDESSAGTHEPTRVITIRIPRSMHEATIREAEELELSINAYCVTKLLQPANARFTPLESGKRRGRRPGPQITMQKVKVKTKK
ncbi:putative HicB family RNase H-like nuclease [Rhodopirellula rubra]|uniref:Putative HicB family RNase H-like nuclease n=1 Tax=Aporhodopirellula rubra TaxID=980271 RepID=A0A7W5E0N8_9BACT|nr:hypothetical protein [Aporhodopirellula rubra]MBB3207991.1 putative HicB family RNase H-like nuclease [Aporhodopirellula rubra]